MTKKTIDAHESVLDLVGNTPLIKLNETVKGFQGSYFAKAEFTNPGHSSKDRIALYIIEEAERKGILKPGNTVIETTSGNTGYSIAMASIINDAFATHCSQHSFFKCLTGLVYFISLIR